jgi:hypothetical protein
VRRVRSSSPSSCVAATMPLQRRARSVSNVRTVRPDPADPPETFCAGPGSWPDR